MTQPERVHLAVKGFTSATGFHLALALIDAHHSKVYAHYVSGGGSPEFVDTRHINSLVDLGDFTLRPYGITYIDLRKE